MANEIAALRMLHCQETVGDIELLFFGQLTGWRGHERAVAEFGVERYVSNCDQLYQRIADQRMRS